MNNVYGSSSLTRKWATGSLHSSFGTSRAWHQMYWTTSYAPSGPVGYHPTCKQSLPARPRAVWTQLPASQTICEITLLPTMTSISAPAPDNAVGLRECISELERMMASLWTSRAHSRSHSRHRRSRTPPASRSRHDLCWYHRRFGNRARKCTPPCTRQSGNSAS